MALTRPKFAQFDTTITSITDPQLVLNTTSNVANVDIGFVFNRDGGISANTAIIWQESSLSFVLATTSNSGVTNSNISLTDYANLKVGNLVANAGIYTDHLYFANGSPYSVGGGGGSSYDQSLNTTDTVRFGQVSVGTSGGFETIIYNDAININGSWALTESSIETFTGNVSANVVTANVFIGDGSQLTGLPESYSNVNVAAYLPVYTGNISADTLYGNLSSTTGDINITGNLIPTANVTYDLGSPTHRFRDGWFSGTTIYIGSESMGVDADGKWSFTSNGATVELGSSVEFNPPAANISGNVVAGDFYFTNGVSVMSAVSSMVSAANTAMLGHVDSVISSTEGNITTANTAMKGYVDSVISSTAANITTANTAMKGYVDSQFSSVNTNKANIASPTFTGTVEASNITVTSNLTVTGDFTVTGTSTSLNTENISINDPLLYLGENNPFDLIDIGLVGSYTRDGNYHHTGIVRDATDQTWKFFEDVIAEPTAVVDFGGAVYAPVLMGSLETIGNAVIGGNIRLAGRLQDDAGQSGESGQYLTSTGSGIAWTSIELSTNNIIEGNSSVIATADYVNVAINSANVSSFNSDGLLVLGNLQLIGGLQDSSGNSGTNGQYLTSTGSEIAWVNLQGSAALYTASNTVPSSPTVNDIWYDTDTGILFQYQNDGDSEQWVDINSNALNTNIATVSGTSLSITGNGSIGGSFTSGGAITINSSNAPSAIINGGTNGVGNIGSSGNAFNMIFARSTSAQYADLAERYTSDVEYAPGTVMIFGGQQEVTESTYSHDPRIAGVVTTSPAHLMNDGIQGTDIALIGRVPCRVLGPVNKGDRLVSSDVPGVAQRLDPEKYIPGCIIGKSLENVDHSNITTIEVAVGRF